MSTDRTTEILNYLSAMSREFGEFRQEFRQFREEVNTRFEKIETRLDRVEARLDAVEARLERIEARLDHIERGRLVNNRMVDNLGFVAAELRTEIGESDRRVRRLEEERA